MEKIILKVISNTKIIMIIFLFNENFNYQDFAKLTGVLDKGGQENVKYGS